ncbi:hypothetical protein ACIBEA_43975 [Streptomyces sp. NPDC051555]|uniref:hypothetical protein n=1 Tax=Streptomyces sp. NPDC051555 TaxID=3365657 RepID=UPI00379B8690
MGNPVVRNGDQITAPAPAPAVWLTPVVVTLGGTGGFSVGGKVVCIPKDVEDITPEVTASYNAPALGSGTPVPGTGKIKFTLAVGHKASMTKTKGEPVVVNDGASLTYRFTPETPAQVIPPTGPTAVDKTPFYDGTATFLLTPMPKLVTAG